MKIRRPVGKRMKACLLIAVVAILIVSIAYIYTQKSRVGSRNESFIESFEDENVTTERVTNRTIIKVRNPEDIEGIVSRIKGAKLVRTYGNFPNMFVIETGWDEIEAIKYNPDIISTTEDKFLYISLDDSVPQIQANMTYKMGETRYDRFAGQGIKVALFDTSVNTSHPAFQDSVINGLNGSKFIDWVDCAFGQEWQTDFNGHGTHTSGIIGSNDSTTRGVAPDASLLMAMVCDYHGACGYSAIICGFDWAINHSVNVVSMSIGYDTDTIDDVIIEAVQKAIVNNITVVLSQGNSYVGIGGSPANAWNAIGVGAVSKSDVIASWSSGNVIDEGLIKPDVSAPGVSINSSICQEMWGGGNCNPSGFAEMSGTSMAAPHIAGVAAIYHQAYKNDTGSFPRPLIVKSAIERGTIDLGAKGKDTRYGVGRVSTDKVLNMFYQSLNASKNATVEIFSNTTMSAYNQSGNGRYLNATIYGGIELGFNANSSDATQATCTLMNYNSTSWKANFTFDCPLLSGKSDYIYRTTITGTVGTYWELAMNTSTSLSYLHFTHFWARENTSQTVITESLNGLGRDKEFVVSSPVPLNFESKNDTVAIFNFTIPQQAANALFITYWEEDLNKDGIHYVFSTTLTYPNGTNATFDPIYNDTTIMSNISVPASGNWKLYVTLEELNGMLNITGDNNAYLGVSYNISRFIKTENTTGWQRNTSVYINESIGTSFYTIYYNSTLSPVSLSFKRIMMQPSAIAAGFNDIYGGYSSAYNKVVFDAEKSLNRNLTTANDTFWDSSMASSIPFTQIVELLINSTSNQTVWNITLNSSLGLTNATVWINLNDSMVINQLTVEMLNSTGSYETLAPINRCSNTNMSAAYDNNFTSITMSNGEVWQMCWGKTLYNVRTPPNFFKYVMPTISTNRTLRVYGETAKIFLIQPLNNTPTTASQGQNISLRFMTVHRSLLLNCSLSLDGLINQTRTNIANGTVAEFNVSVDQKDYTWKVNCTGD